MADDTTSSGGDVTEADLGKFENSVSKTKYGVLLGIWAFVKSVIVFLMSIVMVVIAATIHIVPLIFTLLQKAVGLVTSASFPDKPQDIPGADFLAISDTFFPVHELFAAMSLYYVVLFSLFVVRVCVGIGKFGLRWTIEIIKMCLP